MQATNTQKAAIATLMAKLRIGGEAKDAMVRGFTGGRTASRAQLSSEEANALIAHLKELDTDEASSNRMRRKIVALAHEMGWHRPGTQQADMKRIDDWCQKYGALKKKLNRHTGKELPALLTQFRKAHAHFIKNL